MYSPYRNFEEFKSAIPNFSNDDINSHMMIAINQRNLEVYKL